jgi:ubiquinone/menaquinone biosynthesis C-methylase UbiE
MEKEEYQQMYRLENHHWWFLAKRNFISVVFPKKKNLDILDVGVGTGGTTKFLEKFGNVLGIESNKLALNLAKKRKLKIFEGEAEKPPFTDNKFDVITFFDVLYHQNIKSDLKALKEAYRVLKPKGTLVITDCAFEFLRSPHDEAVWARERYRRKTLAEKVKKAGFKIEKASYIFFFLFPLIAIKRLFSCLKAKFLPKSQKLSDVSEIPEIFNKILLLICILESYLLRYIDFPWGSSIIIRARKT